LQCKTKKQVKKMPVIYDLTKDIRFKEGVEVGLERGEKRGEKLGKKLGEATGKKLGEAIGEQKKARLTAIRMLNQEEFSIVKIAELLDVPLDFVVQIQNELQHNPDLK
jgi:predicted transposase YdaD